MVSVLFTDIVGSTELLGRLGERDYDEVRRRHFAALRTALADHDGTEVKNTGDGLMAVFRSAVDAVDWRGRWREKKTKNKRKDAPAPTTTGPRRGGGSTGGHAHRAVGGRGHRGAG